jgi:hypothetical protein
MALPEEVEEAIDRGLDPETIEPSEHEVEVLAQNLVTEALASPIDFLFKQFGSRAESHVLHFAIRGGQKIREIAEQAVEDSGPDHYLGEDGKTWETPSGFVYWRV